MSVPLAPGVSDVDDTRDDCSRLLGPIDSVADPNVKSCLLHIADQMRNHQLQQNQQFQMLLNGQNSLVVTMNELITKISVQSCPPVFPMVVHASSAVPPLTSSSSSHVSSVKRSRRGSSSGSSNGDMLTCLWCGATHDNEKAHWQHVDRLAKHIGKLYYGDCCIPDGYASLRHFAGATAADKMLAMLRKYNSFISSSKVNGINRVRAAKLAEWLISIR